MIKSAGGSILEETGARNGTQRLREAKMGDNTQRFGVKEKE